VEVGQHKSHSCHSCKSIPHENEKTGGNNNESVNAINDMGQDGISVTESHVLEAGTSHVGYPLDTELFPSNGGQHEQKYQPPFMPSVGKTFSSPVGK